MHRTQGSTASLHFVVPIAIQHSDASESQLSTEIVLSTLTFGTTPSILDPLSQTAALCLRSDQLWDHVKFIQERAAKTGEHTEMIKYRHDAIHCGGEGVRLRRIIGRCFEQCFCKRRKEPFSSHVCIDERQMPRCTPDRCLDTHNSTEA